ncbi:hypothetical protein BV898_07670 [Hypsibius exemplaris]|uniref:BHLH domain-containing protein n=1 Tax=Hypsibius exemplaris TaxID=2072580 RepID=A0A1W0WSV1_HYPEX|nr:hypothetical protein BV898_07670 [Hypsibius exemplaris]
MSASSSPVGPVPNMTTAASPCSSTSNRDDATVRERSRMHNLNYAFDRLRLVVPRANLADHQRLSKIATLRLAIHYIHALRSILLAGGGHIRPIRPIHGQVVSRAQQERPQKKSTHRRQQRTRNSR